MIALIKAKGVGVIREGRVLLEDVSLDIFREDTLTIIGPNGAGKTTLLHCLLGVMTPNVGSITRQENLTIGYVPQHFFVNKNIPITVGGFLSLSPNGRTSISEELFDTLNIPSPEQFLYTLSAGELQSVLLARALLKRPQLLVLDEPAKNLDISSQIAFYQLLEKITQKRSISVLMVSHDLHIVMMSTKRVLCLYHHVCCSGVPHVVAKDPKFVSLFGKDMASMVAIYQHHHDHIHVY